jgi:hypothetical protein
MCKDDEVRSRAIARLFYLITAEAEDAAALAAAAQSPKVTAAEHKSAAAKLRSSGEMIEIVASAIELLERCLPLHACFRPALIRSQLRAGSGP